MYAANIGIHKDLWKAWMKKYSPNWDVIPEDTKKKIKKEERTYRESCLSRPVPPKHKYCYILGKNKKETKQFKKIFEQNNPKLVNLSYPKRRGE